MSDPAQLNHYKAAVYDRRVAVHDRKANVKVDENNNDAMAAVARMNLSLYEETAKAAKADGAQIIVFPEFGVSGIWNCLSSSRIEPFAQPVGEPGDDLTQLDDSSPIVRQLATIAKNCSIVVVANVCEKTKDGKLYNTEVAIDATGKLLAKYHKMHPFLIQTFDTPTEKEVVTFETSFGVTFGLFICKALLHSEPQTSIIHGCSSSGSSTVVPQIAYSVYFSSNWLSRWYISSWAKKNGATILVSNLGGGGGIFAGRDNGADVIKKEGYTLATIYL